MDLSSEAIAKSYSLEHRGPKGPVKDVGSFESQGKGVLLWTKSEKMFLQVQQGTLIAPLEFAHLPRKLQVTYLLSEKSPRLIFARCLNDYFAHLQPDDFTNHIDRHRKNKQIRIGENCFIGANVNIGDGTEILHNTSIFSNTTIGRDCLINTCCSIGTPGLGLEYDGDEIVRFPQIGGVAIGDNVEIGPSTTIRRGTLGNTTVGDGTKMGSFTNIGHNCQVGKQCILTSQVALGGSTILGDKVFMGINSCTRNKVSIGSHVTVGIGSVVIKDFHEATTLVGIPAKKISRNGQ